MPFVQQWWGDSDYEYAMTFPPDSVDKLRAVMHLPKGAKEELLEAIEAAFSGKESYNQLGEFFQKNDIQYESISGHEV
jgi:hypothetical protein